MRVHLETQNGRQDIIIMKYNTGGLAFVNMTTHEVTKSKFKTPKRAFKELTDLPGVVGAEIVAEDGGTREDTFDHYQEKVSELKNRFSYDDDNDQANHALMMLSAATGSVSGSFQKTYQGFDLDMEQLVSSAGDVVAAVSLLMDAAGIDLSDVIEINLSRISGKS